MTLTEQILAQLPGNSLEALRRSDSLWQSVRKSTRLIPTVIQSHSDALVEPEWDVVICGATLGVILGTTLVRRGYRVALLEQGLLRGRVQEWNISRRELEVLVRLDLVTEAGLQKAIATEYNPARISFCKGSDIWIRDVLNIGISPLELLEQLKARFLELGGQLFEQTAFAGAIVHPNGVEVQTRAGVSFKTRLLLDNMGHFSPIAQQARQGQKPDGMCLVVGSCAQGFPQNEKGDLLVSFTPIQNHCQYFWEAFPAQDGRTTYLFTYLDAHPDRPSLEALLDDYFTLLPQYQQVELAQLNFQRVLWGILPCYRQSPLQPQWDRIVQVGDSSGNQSPLSFGGFGALLRHLERLDRGIHEALQGDCLDRSALALLQPYQPNLSVTWLFQRSMSVGVNQTIDPNQMNRLLTTVFQVMAKAGDPVLKPFLQDVIQFPALAQTMLKTGLQSPLMIPQVLPQVGLLTLLDWSRHYLNLAGYAALAPLSQVLEPVSQGWDDRQRYFYHRWQEAWHYGSGQDYGDRH